MLVWSMMGRTWPKERYSWLEEKGMGGEQFL